MTQNNGSQLEDDRRLTNNCQRPRIERVTVGDMPPHDAEAEQGLLAAEIYKPGSFAQVGVVRSDFYTATGREIFDALEAMQEANAQISFETLRYFLRKCPSDGGLSRLEAVGGEGTINAIESCTSGSIYLNFYFERVRSRAVLRRVKETALAIAGQASNPMADPTALLEFARTELSGVMPLRQQSRFDILNAEELANGSFEQNFYIDNTLAVGQPTGIYGSFKTLKTSTAAAMGFSLATGFPFLGQFEVIDKVPFLIMSGESGLAAIQDVMRRICVSAGWGLDQLKDRFFTSSVLPRFGNAADMRDLGQIIKKRGIKVLAIDPIYLCMDVSDQASNLFAMGRYLREMGDACREWGVTLVILHHCKRGPNIGPDRFQPAELSDIAWSGFAEFSAQWLLLSRRSKFDAEIGNHELWLNVGGRAGHGGLYGVDIREGRRTDPGGRVWQVKVRPASETRASAIDSKESAKEAATERKQAATVTRRLAKAAEALLSLGAEPETESRIAAQAGLSSTAWGPVFLHLKTNGIIEKVKIKKGNRPYDAWKVVNQEWCTKTAQEATQVESNGAAVNGARLTAPTDQPSDWDDDFR